MKRSVLAVTVAALIAVMGCSALQTPPDSAAASPITVVDPADRKAAPKLAGEDLTGEALSSADFTGQVMVVNLWGPWCGPCRKEAPMLREVAAAYADKDVQFLGIVNDASSDWAESFNRQHKITYPNFADQGGRLEMGFNKSLPTQGVPTTWIVDRNGKVAVRIVEPELTAATLSGLIDDVLAQA